MANYIAAIGNGGTLYRTQVVEKIARSNGDILETFNPQVISKLPMKQENIKYIQDAMHLVITDHNGTAHKQFLGMNINIHGKTGTATNSQDIEHAWFGGYTDQGDGNDIAMVVMCEMAGEGSTIAAPIFRRVLEYKYYGHALQMYPWEVSLFVTKTPTPLPPDTATPGPSPTPNPG
jgi:penicillin-binding protein 2